MDSAISAAFNPIALYGTYMRLLYCCNYFALYASFLPPFILLYFLHFIPFSSKACLASGWENLPRADQSGNGAVTCSPRQGCAVSVSPALGVSL